jgi:hypothetical protein
MDYEKVRSNKKQFESMTSLQLEEFDALYEVFYDHYASWIRHFKMDGTPRTRRYVAKTAVTEAFSPEMKLFFILLYEKTNPLQETLAVMFEMDQPSCNKWIKILSPLLAKSLSKYKAERNSAIFSANVEINKTYISDCVETSIQRDSYDQELYYSGKKKHIR